MQGGARELVWPVYEDNRRGAERTSVTTTGTVHSSASPVLSLSDGPTPYGPASRVSSPCPNEICGRDRIYEKGFRTYDKMYEARGNFVHFAHHQFRSRFEDSDEGLDADADLGRTWYESELVAKLREVQKSQTFYCINVLALITSLFVYDAAIYMEVPDNIASDVLLTFGFAAFFVEFFAQLMTEAAYPFSFFFWMDLVGTMSLMFDISYMLGPDARVATKIGISSSGRGLHGSAIGPVWRLGQLVVPLRLIRCLRLGTRATRVARTLKLIKPQECSALSFDNCPLASVIQSQIWEKMRARVAGITIALGIALPLTEIFNIPSSDESLLAWPAVLENDAMDCRKAMHSGREEHVLKTAMRRLNSELLRLSSFYADSSYGPYKVCYGHSRATGDFVCEEHGLEGMHFDSQYKASPRLSLVWEIATETFAVFYDVSMPKRLEAVKDIGFSVFVTLLMLFFSVHLSSNIVRVALVPFQRASEQVRTQCTHIFEYAAVLESVHYGSSAEDFRSETKDLEATESEFELMEKAISKLSAIAAMALAAQASSSAKEELNDDEELLVACFTQQAPPVHEASPMSPRSRHSMKVRSTVKHGRSSDKSNREGLHTQTVHTRLKAITDQERATMFTVDFDALEIAKDKKVLMATLLMIEAEGSADWVRDELSKEVLLTFCTMCEKEYPANPFHNFSHALDTVNSVANLLHTCGAEHWLSEVTHFWLLIAAAGHDLGHIGVNNAFLVETSHQLALTYNDRSPLENLHCTKLFEILRNGDGNVFRHVEKEEYKEIRKGIVEAILHTDITKHNEMLKELGVLYQMHAGVVDGRDANSINELFQEHDTLLTNLILHSADVANPLKPWHLCQKWAHLCLDEFFAQGDQEKKLQIPVQMLNDRDKVSRPNSQVGFMEFMMLPMVESIIYVFPELIGQAERLSKNIKKWSDVWIEEAQPSADARDKVRARVHKAVVRCDSLRKHVDRVSKDKAAAKSQKKKKMGSIKVKGSGPV